MDHKEDAWYAIDALVRRAEVQVTYELPIPDSLTTAGSACQGKSFALDPPEIFGRSPEKVDWTSSRDTLIWELQDGVLTPNDPSQHGLHKFEWPSEDTRTRSYNCLIPACFTHSEEMVFNATNVSTGFEKRNCKGHMCDVATSNIKQSSVNDFHTGARPNLIHTSFIALKWSDHIPLIHNMSL